MLKKILALIIFIICSAGGYYLFTSWNTGVPTAVQPVEPSPSVTSFEDKVYTYNPENLPQECNINSAMACAVEFAVKCTINPDFAGCRQSNLPKFIFMEDPSLDRPTEISFKISKDKPIAADLVEIYTESTCNGNWFGLCQGNIIYVIVPTEDAWRVKDIYAIEQ